ncbi:flagellin [Rhodobacterales bacterium FZCC0083]|nr:flagellin [Rhodobacterales bacterium FZCC0083]
MALNIATDSAYLLASKSSDRNTVSLNQSMERLTSGLRINSASDDAAGVAVATRINSDVQGMRMAIRNATDGQSMIDTAEGAMVEITNIMQRMRELALQSANGTNSQSDREMIQLEIDQLTEEVNRIAQSTQWAGQSIFNGVRGANELATSHDEVYQTNFQIGPTPNDNDNIQIDFKAITALALGIEGSGITPTVTASATNVSGTTVTPSVALAPTITTSVTDYTENVLQVAIASDTSATIDINSYQEGASYSVTLNGQTISITASNSDGYADTVAGLTTQMVDAINAKRHSTTSSNLGLSATESGGTITVTYGLSGATSSDFSLTAHTSADNVDVEMSLSSDDTVITYTAQGFNTSGGIGAHSFKMFGVTVTVPEVDVIPNNGHNGDPYVYSEQLKESIETAMQTAGISGITVTVGTIHNPSGTPQFDITLSPDLSVTNVVTTDTNAANAPTLTASNGTITVGGFLASGDILTANVDGTAVNTTLTSSLTSATAAAGQMVADINAANITGVTATDNGDGTFSLAKASQLSESNGTVTVGSSLSAGDTLQIDIDGTTITTNITSSLTTATAAATQMVADINAANIAGLTVTDNLNGTFALARGPSISEANGLITVAGNLSVGDTLEMTIAGTSVSTTITSSITTASAAATQLVADITAASINGLNITDNGNGTFSMRIGGDLSVMSANDAHKAINTIDHALQMVSTDRALFGALSNRFDMSISNLTNVASNSEMSLGRLQDADFAAETSRLTTSRILEQASIAMMAQANAAKQNVLQLLG